MEILADFFSSCFLIIYFKLTLNIKEKNYNLIRFYHFFYVFDLKFKKCQRLNLIHFLMEKRI